MTKIDWKEVTWYLISAIFPIIGGIIAYFANKDKRPKIAWRFLFVALTSLFGLIILSIFDAIEYFIKKK
jgi:MFS family permease